MTETIKRPKCINPRWLSQQKTKLGYCAEKAHDGSPNPNHTKLADEIAVAEAELKRWEEFESWVESSLGATRNRYPLRTAEGVFEERTCFVKKGPTGRITHWTFQAAWELFLAAKQEGGVS